MSTSLNITVCPDCDLVLPKHALQNNQVAICTRCGAVVYQEKKHYIDKTLAFSLAGLLFYIPANILPILSFGMLSFNSTNTMWNGVEHLFETGYWWMGFLVLMCSIVVPLLDLTLLLLISFSLKFGFKRNKVPIVRQENTLISKTHLKQLLLWQQTIKDWGMLEVYLLGIVVAYIKMLTMGNIVIGTGLYCFIGMVLSTLLAQSSFNTESGFNYLDSNHPVKQH
ncbi:MAG: paraquat-inducible protein A [Gammaproteobacteria bacterium]|nr:paraquat-inducible protein A [Gammaproteobacteria bacterium]